MLDQTLTYLPIVFLSIFLVKTTTFRHIWWMGQVAIFQETVAAKALACVDHLLLRASQANLVAISLSPGVARSWPWRMGEWGGHSESQLNDVGSVG